MRLWLGALLVVASISQAAQASAVSDAERVVKLIINMNHRLCAKVTYVEATDREGIYHVRCIENIGGRRTIDYLVNGHSNAVVRI